MFSYGNKIFLIDKLLKLQWRLSPLSIRNSLQCAYPAYILSGGQHSQTQTFSSATSATDQNSESEVLETDVCIVGAGPTGITTALLLQRYGIDTVVLENAPSPTDHPQAHVVMPRSLEILRPLGLSSYVTAQAPPLDVWRKFTYCSTMTGQIIAEDDHFPKTQLQPYWNNLSPEPFLHLSQHKLTRILLAALVTKHPTPFTYSSYNQPDATNEYQNWIKSRGLSGYFDAQWQQVVDSNIKACDLRMSTKVTKVEQHGSLVTVMANKYTTTREAKKLQNGDIELRPNLIVKCEHLIAADGANSGIRRQLGIKLEGEDEPLQSLINIHFISKQLSEALKSRPAMLYFVYNPDIIAVVVTHCFASGEFVAQIPYFPPLQTPQDYSEDVCRTIVQQAAGVPRLSMEIKTTRPWAMTAQVANRFQIGNIYLAGDSAHRFPPSGGLGMNTSIPDAHNLAWKIASTIKGMSGPQLLTTYETQRKPVAQINADKSVDNWRKALKIPNALGLPYQVADLTNKLFKGIVPGMVGQDRASSMLTNFMRLGQAWGGAQGLLSQSRIQHVQKIIENGESLKLLYFKEDLGYIYNYVSSNNQTYVATKQEQQAKYRPFKAQSLKLLGSRMPHTQVTTKLKNGQSCTLSSLDLLSSNQLQILVLLFKPECQRNWIQIINKYYNLLSNQKQVMSVQLVQSGYSNQHSEKHKAQAQSFQNKTNNDSNIEVSQWVQQSTNNLQQFLYHKQETQIEGVSVLYVEGLNQIISDSSNEVGNVNAIFVLPDGHIAAVVYDNELESLSNNCSNISDSHANDQLACSIKQLLYT